MPALQDAISLSAEPPIVTLDEVKEQIRVEHEDEDELIETYMAAAVERVASMVDPDIEATDGNTASAKVAIMTAVAALFADRENPAWTNAADQFIRDLREWSF